MSLMSLIRFTFSIKGFLLFLLLYFIWFIAHDYPRWKKGNQQTKESTHAPIKGQTTIAHYILITPFAALYVVVRALFDAIRYSIYYILWYIERSLPHLDNWLFETITVRLPTGIQRLQNWWSETAQPNIQECQEYFNQHTVPFLIEITENTGNLLYQFGCVIHVTYVHCTEAVKRFADNHDWKRLAEDIGDVVYNIVISLVRLCTLIYNGCSKLVLSIKYDMIWIASYIPPIVEQTVRVALWTVEKFEIFVGPTIWIRDTILAPTLGRLLSWIVKGIDCLLLMIQKNSHHLDRIYYFLAPQIVWTIMNAFQTGTNICKVAKFIYKELKPVFQLFLKNVLPRLSIAYQKFRDRILQNLAPVWNLLVPYIQHIGEPLVIGIQKAFYLIINQCLPLSSLIQIAMGRVFIWSTICMNQMYLILQQWLVKQAPILSQLLQQIYNYNWDEWSQELSNITFSLYKWTSEQSRLVYASLERSLIIWSEGKKNQ